MNSPENLTTVAADNDLGKTMAAAESTLLTALPGVNTAPPNHFLLHLHEYFSRHDCVVISFDIILRHNAGVLDPMLVQEVLRVSLLQKRVADIFFVPQDLVQVAGVPSLVTSPVEDPIIHQASGDFQHAGTFQIFPIDAFDDLGLFGDDDQLVVFTAGITQEAITVDLHLALLVAVLQPHFHVLAQGLAFLLGKGGHDRQLAHGLEV